MMLRWEGHVWRKKKKLQGLCFYIYNPTRQAELKEGYLRQRHLRNKLWGPHSSVVHGHCLKPGRGTPALAISTQQQPLLSRPGRTPSFPAAPLHIKSFGCSAGLEPAEGLGTLCRPMLFETSSHGACEKSEACSTHVACVFVCGWCVARTYLSLRLPGLCHASELEETWIKKQESGNAARELV